MQSHSLTVPKEMQDKYNEITAIIRVICEGNLNEEYELLCFQLCAALYRKWPSPRIRGKANIWACGIVHLIGTVNFQNNKKKRQKGMER